MYPQEHIHPSELAEVIDHLKGSDPLEVIGTGNHRSVQRIGETNFVLKTPFLSVPYSRSWVVVLEALSQCACIMYQVSQQLGFSVVPYTQYIMPDSSIAQRLQESCLHLKHPMLLQRYITPAKVPLDLQHAHRVVIFNWLIGKPDPKYENSILDMQGKVWEIDNELGGKRLDVKPGQKGLFSNWTPHWLFMRPEVQVPLCPSLIQHVRALPENIKLDQKLFPEHFQSSLVTSIEQVVTSNLKFLKRALLSLRGESVTLEKLKTNVDQQLEKA
ncbi:MAG: hypothetical protein JSS62_01305 [Verrucomicrobia bacterium]|nr:hypothetical protein [Verrucomicrobiota bacterium]MBS0645807.1 hypothetical protein [Verrucomicrobiota bacterium]